MTFDMLYEAVLSLMESQLGFGDFLMAEAYNNTLMHAMTWMGQALLALWVYMRTR